MSGHKIFSFITIDFYDYYLASELVVIIDMVIKFITRHAGEGTQVTVKAMGSVQIPLHRSVQ